jgi:hypothetical protein
MKKDPQPCCGSFFSPHLHSAADMAAAGALQNTTINMLILYLRKITDRCKNSLILKAFFGFLNPNNQSGAERISALQAG